MQDDASLRGGLDGLGGTGDTFAAAVRATRMPMLITDPRQADNPIVFVNDAFLRMSGYDRDEVIGHNCRFLQGPDTNPAAVEAIRSAVRAGQEVAIDLLNYRKDGTPFWNALFISPVTNESGHLLFFFASQLDVTERKRAELAVAEDRDRIEEAVARRTVELEQALAARTELLHEVDHRVKNNLQLVTALIFIESRLARDDTAATSLNRLRARVAALSAVHRLLERDRDVVRFDVAALIREFAAEVAPAGAIFSLDLERVSVSAAYAAPVALLVSELIRLAVARTKASGADGAITLAVKPAETGRYRFSIAASGALAGIEASLTADERAFVDRLCRQLRADLSWQDGGDTEIAVLLPIDEPTRGA